MSKLKLLILLLIPFKALAFEGLAPVKFSQLKGWQQDNHENAKAAFLISCRQPLEANPKPLRKALLGLCESAKITPAKTFFERHFSPMRVKAQGFLTGYYEPEVLGSRIKSARFNAPLYLKPDDLVSISPDMSEKFPSRGRAVNLQGQPYFTRGEIEAGALNGRKHEIVYLENANESFFIAIQGSARVKLHEGGSLRVGYDAHNGHPYTAIGKVLAERNIAPVPQITMSFLRSYMAADEPRASELRAQNKSFVFFRELKVSDAEGPIGGEGVPVTAYRTLAVDKFIHPYALPIFIESTLPLLDMQAEAPFNQLMIAQDTGSAIRGVARGDLYLGTGKEIGILAGNIRHQATWTLLFPKGFKP